MRDVLAAILKAEGHVSICASNGEEAIEVLRSHPVDLILTDILMPEMDGLEFIKEARAMLRSVPIVAFSGGGYLASRSFCLKTAKAIGANAVMPKPFDRQQLLTAIDDAVSLNYSASDDDKHLPAAG
jgi:CheY-like chemotaxis protein